MEKSNDKLNENFLQGIIDEKARLLEKIERLDIMADTKFQEKELYEYFVSTFENWEKFQDTVKVFQMLAKFVNYFVTSRLPWERMESFPGILMTCWRRMFRDFRNAAKK